MFVYVQTQNRWCILIGQHLWAVMWHAGVQAEVISVFVCVKRGAHRREGGLMTEICARAMWQALKDPYTPLTMVPVTAAVPPNLERGPGVRRPRASLQGSGHVKSICISPSRRDALAHKHKHTSGAFRIRHACQRSKVTASRNTRLSARTIH